MKIVFATDIYFPLVGGIQVVTKRLAEKLSEAGNEVSIIAPSSSRKDSVEHDGPVTVYYLASLRIPFYASIRYISFAAARRKVFRLLQGIGPDVIHIQTNISIAKAAATYAKKFNVPVVATGHVTNDEVAFAFKDFKVLADLVGTVLAGLYKDVWKDVDVLTSPSRTTVNYFHKYLRTKKEILPISNGIDLKKFSLAKDAGKRKPRIIFVGRLDPVKQVRTLIEAMPRILKRLDAELVLIGAGSEEAALRSLVADLGIVENVRFYGFVSEKGVIDNLRKADVFVMASAIETQGIAAIEAMAAGLPVVASKVGALPENVRHGKNGYLFPSGDSRSLANYVVRILSDRSLAARMGRESVRIAKTHDINEVVYKMETLYRKAAAISERKAAIVARQPAHKWLAVKVALAVFLIAVLFRWSFFVPALAKAKEIKMGDRIKNSIFVKKVEGVNLNFKKAFSENR